MKKKLTILLVVLFLITAFVGCSSKNEETLSTHNDNYGISHSEPNRIVLFYGDGE